MARSQKPVRWWLLFVIIALSILTTVVIWVLDAGYRQDKILGTFMVVIFATFLGILWLLGFSRLSWRIRLIAFATVVFGVFLSANLFQFKGFSGDLTPIFEWRWQEKPSTFRQDPDSTFNTEVSVVDYPQFLGQHWNGVVTGIQLNRDWDAHPRKLVWRQPVGAGWSGFAVVGNSAITQEQEDDWEKVVCYELRTGEIKWSHRDQARYYAPPAGLGPRATPTISGNRVYTVGSTGILNCLDFETGVQLWTTHIFEENEAEPPPWGVSISPLIFDELVVVSPGAKLYQFSRNPTGEFDVSIIWETINLKAKFTNIIYHKGYLYGLDDGIFVA